MSITDQELQKALLTVHKNERVRSILKSAQGLGITTLSFAKLFLKEEELTLRALRETMDRLVTPLEKNGVAPLLERHTPKLFGINGRPESVDILTDLGGGVLNELVESMTISAPQIRDPWDLTHRYIILKVAEKVQEEGLNSQMEHIFKNAVQEVRADLYLEINTVQIVVEVEQKLLRRNIKRARDKFTNWAAYIREAGSGGVWRIYLVLNVRKRELPTLIRYWREALAEARNDFGELPYDVYAITVNELLDSPSFTDVLLNANLLDESNPEENDLPAVFIGEEDWDEADKQEEALPDYLTREQYLVFQDTLDELSEAPPDEALLALTELAGVIHTASYYKNSPSLKVAVFPWASIWLMRRYLEHPSMAAVKTELANALNKIHKRNPGMVMLRETVTSLLWDVLLFHHGLGRGGALRVIFQVPDFQDRSSDFRVEVRVDDDLRAAQTDDVKALSWFFTSIYLYRHHLGLVENTKK